MRGTRERTAGGAETREKNRQLNNKHQGKGDQQRAPNLQRAREESGAGGQGERDERED